MNIQILNFDEGTNGRSIMKQYIDKTTAAAIDLSLTHNYQKSPRDDLAIAIC
jgi:hypothetical protein